MLQGYTPIPLEHFGGLVTNWPPQMLDCDLMVEATNVRYTQAAVSTREGLTLALATPSGAAVRGLADYAHLDGTEQPVVFDAEGHLYVESPAGSGALAAADGASPTQPPAGAWMNAAAAFGRLYMTFGNGLTGTAQPLSFDGSYLDPVTLAGPGASTGSAADSASAGQVASGQRYGVVLFKTREGSLTAPSFPFQWTAEGGKQVTVTDLPLGPAHQVVARIVAFTVAGGSSAGPYFYIEDGQTVNSVVETATLVNDNVSTSATFNFDDDFLAASLDSSDQFRAALLANCQGVMFSQTTQRLLWWGDPAQPATVYCSEPGDAGLYLGDTGFFQVEEGSGLKVTAVFEFRNQLYVALERGIYLVTPNDGDPATWSITHIAQSVGAVGPRALAVGTDMVFMVHESGAYVFSGGAPTWISEELLGPSSQSPGAWEQINWANRALIWCAFDHNEKCVRVGVPTGDSAVCDTIYKVSYLDGWDPSLRFSAFTARYHYFPGRRWSRDTIAASQAVEVRRPLALPPIPADRRLVEEQILVASSEPNGAVYLLDASADEDEGVPIAWALTTGSFSSAELIRQQRQGIELIGIVQLRARGQGTVSVETVADGQAPSKVGEVMLAPALPRSQSVLALVQGEAVSLRLSGGTGDAPSTIQLEAAYVFAKPVWALWPGGK
ncbi:MAG: hypothetical protein ACRD1C_03750 [Terriglobales bacterium]